MKTVNQMLKFFGVSVLGWIIDFSIYNLFIFLFNVNISVINVISSLIGVTFIFIFSTRKIFESSGKHSIKTKYVIYVLYQVILILSVSRLLPIFRDYLISFDISAINQYVNAIAKVMVTPITASLNFVVMKFVIEKL